MAHYLLEAGNIGVGVCPDCIGAVCLNLVHECNNLSLGESFFFAADRTHGANGANGVRVRVRVRVSD